MAKNLRAKIPEGDTMTIFDVNAASLEKFSQEASPSGVIVAKSPREVAENSVSACLRVVLCLVFVALYDEPFVLSMI